MNISSVSHSLSTQGYQPSPRQTESSESGKLLAELSRDSYDSARGEWSSVRKLAADGLRKIRDNSEVTGDERALSKLGLQIGSHYLYDQDAARMQRSVLGTIAAAVPGLVGQVLAQTTLDAFSATSSSFTWEQARSVTNDGLDAVISNDSTSQSEKDLASLGQSLSSGYQYNDEATKIKKTVLKKLARGTEGSMPQVLAETTLEVRSEVPFRTWNTVRKLESTGLRAIRDHADSSDYDKTIASLGLNFGDDYMYDEDAGKIQRQVLQALKSPGTGNISYEVARVTKDAVSPGIRYSAGRKVQKEAFETILTRHDATETQKTMAQMGIDVGADNMTDQEAFNRRSGILDKLIALG